MEEDAVPSTQVSDTAGLRSVGRSVGIDGNPGGGKEWRDEAGCAKPASRNDQAAKKLF